MGIDLLRATEKVGEARFFLQRLARTGGKLPHAAHYASATISALRSVTWVLQADLRPIHGARFDSWWNSQKPALGSAGLGFALLRDARNEVEKTGRPLVRQTVRYRYEEGSIEFIEFLIDPGFETLNNFRIRPRIVAGADSGSAARPGKPQIHMEELHQKLAEFGAHWREGRAEIVPTFGHSSQVPFDVAVVQLRDYVEALAKVVRTAERTFAA
jgi:hypothetical protein